MLMAGKGEDLPKRPLHLPISKIPEYPPQEQGDFLPPKPTLLTTCQLCYFVGEGVRVPQVQTSCFLYISLSVPAPSLYQWFLPLCAFPIVKMKYCEFFTISPGSCHLGYPASWPASCPLFSCLPQTSHPLSSQFPISLPPPPPSTTIFGGLKIECSKSITRSIIHVQVPTVD